jgi:beta-phosphoglucomutase-like phosphatase (HAD superfamily)
VTVCGDEVTHPKPAPDPYLRAAELLGVEAGSCVAIEDSVLGVESAVVAGCVVLAVPSEVALPAGPGRVVRESLVGVTVDDLSALWQTARRPADR